MLNLVKLSGWAKKRMKKHTEITEVNSETFQQLCRFYLPLPYSVLI